jgi:hypothetical protein
MRREHGMDFNTRLARFDAALLRVKGRIGKTKPERASARELRELLADLECLLMAHDSDLSAAERRHLGRIRRNMTRQLVGYAPRPTVRQKLLKVWGRIEPKLRKTAAARGSS